MLDSHVNHLQQRLGGLPTHQEAQFVWKDIWHQEVHHSTAIEGNTLILREVSELLEHGRAVGAKPLKEYLEVTGYGAAAEWVYKQAAQEGTGAADRPLISTYEVRHVHYMIMEKVWVEAPHPEAGPREGPGNYRQHDIHPFGAGMTPPSSALVDSMVDDWVTQANDLQSDSVIPIAERVAKIHARFEQIHPFLDGNGRTGRLCMNLILVRLGYPPVIILRQNRDKYLTALQKADGEDYGPLGEQLARAMIENLEKFIIPQVAGQARRVPLSSLADEELSKAALRQAASRGRLEADQQANGIWYSSQAAVEAYKASRHQRTQGPTG